VWHVVQIYAAQGLRDFLLLTGYRGEMIEEFAAATEWPDGVTVRCVDTGEDTPTGGRIHRARGELEGGRFLATYADGVADIDLAELRAFHDGGDALATLTVVRPELQFGIADLNHDHVLGFHEKPQSDHWVNGGFFVFEPGALEYLAAGSVLEREPLEGLAADGQLRAYRHTGFWDCMDTYKDAVMLNDLWETGDPPWKVWSEEQVA
jgi:glucose-1-phosphate cytidylyltransferase